MPILPCVSRQNPTAFATCVFERRSVKLVLREGGHLGCSGNKRTLGRGHTTDTSASVPKVFGGLECGDDGAGPLCPGRASDVQFAVLVTYTLTGVQPNVITEHEVPLLRELVK